MSHVRQIVVEYWHQPIKYRPTCSCGWQSRTTKGTIPDAAAQGRHEHPEGQLR